MEGKGKSKEGTVDSAQPDFNTYPATYAYQRDINKFTWIGLDLCHACKGLPGPADLKGNKSLQNRMPQMCLTSAIRAYWGRS